MAASKKIKNSILSLIAVSLFGTLSMFVPPPSDGTASAMETIFVTASQKTGRYDGPIIVRLTASHPDASIWYTCRRDGTPSDLIKYENPILLSKSCAMIYFAYVTTQLESKIERTDFTILYSDDIKLETENDILKLRNVGKETVDIGGWELIAGTGAIVIPPGTSVPPGEAYDVGRVDPASYALKSPEGYVKSELSVAPKPVVKSVKKFVAKAPATTVTKPVAVIPSIAPVTELRAPETPSTTPVVVPPVATEPVPDVNPDTGAMPPVTETVKPPEVTPSDTVAPTAPTPIPETSPVAPAPATPESSVSNIKASSTESRNTAALPIVITLMFVASVAIIGKRHQKKK